jgi:hypothetical protein
VTSVRPFKAGPAVLGCLLGPLAAQVPERGAALPDRPWTIECDGPGVETFIAKAIAALERHHAAGIGPVQDGMFRLRDATGPLLAWLRLQRYELAREILVTERRCALRPGGIKAEFPVADIGGPAERDAAGPADWSGLLVPPGDLAAWIVIHHGWYLRASQDVATVRSHWPFLEACLRRLPRREAILIPGEGTEPWMPEPGSADPQTWSFANAALFQLAVSMMGSMLDTMDRIEHPDRWRDAPPDPRPGAAWSRRSIQLLHELERRFWCEEQGMFAPVLDPTAVGAGSPFAEANLLPVWAGLLATTGDKTRRNALTTLRHLGSRDGLLLGGGKDGQRSGLGQAMLLAALVQFETSERPAAVRQLLDLALPEGGLARAYAQDGKPIGDADMLATGAALDALLFSICGLRIAACPGFEEEWVRLRPELPPGARTAVLRDFGHDGWRADLWLEHRDGPLDDSERAANAVLPEEQRREPTANHQRIHFALALRSPDPPAGHRLVLLHVRGVQFQERLRRGETFARTAFAETQESVLPERHRSP